MINHDFLICWGGGGGGGGGASAKELRLTELFVSIVTYQQIWGQM